MNTGALVLAGAPNDGRLRRESDARWEALIPANGVPLVNYVTTALLRSSRLQHVVVVGPVGELEPGLPRDARLEVVQERGGLMDNVLAGIERLSGCEYTLISTSDIPLISAAVVDRFLDLCGEREADFYFPIIGKEDNERVCPGTRRTYVRCVDGTFTGGNMALIRNTVVECSARRAAEFIAARKSPVRLAGLLGLSFILRLLVGRVTISACERKVSTLFEISAVAVRGADAEIGIDVDKPEDLALVQQVLAARAG